VGISTDPVDILAKFQTATPAPQRFVADPKGAVASAYGVSFADNGDVFADRVTFVIGKDGKILFSLREPSPLTNVQDTLAWLTKHPQT
jgi:peroxiredoxin